MGQLNIAGGVLDITGAETRVGLRYIFPDGQEGESTSYGCACEGWGAAVTLPDGTTDKAWGNNDWGSVGSVLDFETNDGITALSRVQSNNTKFIVTHDFHPSIETSNLYEVDVTIENTSGEDITRLKYRRSMDWDIHPTVYWECTTIQPDPSLIGFLLAANANGFDNPDPYEPFLVDDRFASAPLLFAGPYDHGAFFDFDFGSLAAGESRGFKIFYGGARTLGEADLALSAVNAELWSYGTPATAGEPDGVCKDMSIEYEGNAVYIFAFAGVGGGSQPKGSKSKKKKKKKTKTTEKTGSSQDLFEQRKIVMANCMCAFNSHCMIDGEEGVPGNVSEGGNGGIYVSGGASPIGYYYEPRFLNHMWNILQF